LGFWLAKFVFLGPLLRLIWRPWIEGRENIPDDRPAILASNHLSFCDSFFMPLMAPRKVTFLAKAEYFTTPGVKGLFSRLFFSTLGQVPIDRSDRDAARAALNTAVRVLGSEPGNNLLGIYPEGTRSPDGRLYRGKTGVARIALESGAVVIPCAMVNTEVIQPTGRLLPKLRPRPGVVIGKPLDFSRYEGMGGDRFVERSMTDEIMYELMELSGQDYVDQYAAKVKAATGKDTGFGSRERDAQRPNVTDPSDMRELGDRVPGTRAS
jgi:1-acyl-sn-glycerol-3-phosphate acyltransferase